MEAIQAWLLVLALQLAPPSKAHQFPGFEETTEQRTARIASIVADIAQRVDKEAPLPGLTKAQSAALFLSLAVEETELDADADKGPCFRGVWKAPGERAARSWAWRCDGGLAVGVVQVHVPLAERDKWFASRPKLLARGYKSLRRALGAKCRFEDRLAVLARGCADYRSVMGSRKVFDLWQRALLLAVAPEWPLPPEPVG